ncbi:MAG: DUF554 domain-containing protein [Omnitrophica WOR_2 bacterium]
MTGTIINVAAILTGGILGILFGSRFPERVRQTIVAGLGLFVIGIGLQMFLKTTNPLIVLGSLLFGCILGEWLRIEDGLKWLGNTIQQKYMPQETGITGQDPVDPILPARSSRFTRGFLTASLLFCIGPMAILGSIQDGLTGDYHLLAIKSILDGFASLAFASSLGAGVLFSSLIILIYQGGLSLLAAQAQALTNQAMMNELTATGGILLVGIALSSLLEIKQIRMGSFLPALLVAPILVAILQAFHWM